MVVGDWKICPQWLLTVRGPARDSGIVFPQNVSSSVTSDILEEFTGGCRVSSHKIWLYQPPVATQNTPMGLRNQDEGGNWQTSSLPFYTSIRSSQWLLEQAWVRGSYSELREAFSIVLLVWRFCMLALWSFSLWLLKTGLHYIASSIHVELVLPCSILCLLCSWPAWKLNDPPPPPSIWRSALRWIRHWFLSPKIGCYDRQ